MIDDYRVNRTLLLQNSFGLWGECTESSILWDNTKDGKEKKHKHQNKTHSDPKEKQEVMEF